MDNISLSHHLSVKTVKETNTAGTFVISGLYPGFGLTVANSLRRILLSSLPGAAITQIKVNGVEHEFSTLPGVVEDLIQITLNLKKVRFKLFSDEPQTLTLKVKGERVVTAADIKLNSNLEVINPDYVVATLTAKNASLDMELTVERGLGYAPAGGRQDEKLSIGLIAIDAFFSPVIKANYEIENIRVGDRTDYNQVTFEVLTDGAIKPGEAILASARILVDNFSKIVSALSGDEETPEPETKEDEDKTAASPE